MPDRLPQRRFFRRPQPKPEVIVLKPKRTEFPSISLNIPEISLTGIALHPVFLTAFVCGFLLMTISIVGYHVRQNTAQLQTALQEHSKLENQLSYWKGITDTYKDYRDALFQVAVLQYRLGHLPEAYVYTKRTLAVDPEYTEAAALLLKLTGK